MNKKITPILSLSILLFIAIGFGFLKTQDDSLESEVINETNEFSKELASVYINDTSLVQKPAESSELSKISEINSKLLSLEDDIEVLDENATTSYYHDKFVGKKTASGEVYNSKKYTAAHKSLPFGSKIRVTNNANDESVIVTVNDRGPFSKSRKLDISKQAFLDITHNKHIGTLKVKIEVLPDDYQESRSELLENLDEFIL